MDKIIGTIGGVPDYKGRNDDFGIDKLSHRYTSAILVVFAVIVTTSQFVGEAINCWVPAHFSDSWASYTNSYCWIRNTYYLPFEEYIPKEHEEDKRDHIPYYQWVPIILLVQALLFYLPCMVWRTLNCKSGIDVHNIVETGEALEKLDENDEKEKKKIEEKENYLKNQMKRYLDKHDDKENSCTVSLKKVFSYCCFCCGRRQGNYLVGLYTFVKILYLANVLIQLFALNAFLGTAYHMYGFDVLKSLYNGNDTAQSVSFPRVTMCDFKVRRLGNVQRYTVQCVLPINLFNERVYQVLWFWFVMVAVLTSFSLLSHLKSYVGRKNYNYISSHLQVYHTTKKDNQANKLYHKTLQEKQDYRSFYEDYLHPDGVFVFKLVEANSNYLVGNTFIGKIYHGYEKNEDNSNENNHNGNTAETEA